MKWCGTLVQGCVLTMQAVKLVASECSSKALKKCVSVQSCTSAHGSVCRWAQMHQKAHLVEAFRPAWAFHLASDRMRHLAWDSLRKAFLLLLFRLVLVVRLVCPRRLASHLMPSLRLASRLVWRRRRVASHLPTSGQARSMRQHPCLTALCHLHSHLAVLL